MTGGGAGFGTIHQVTGTATFKSGLNLAASEAAIDVDNNATLIFNTDAITSGGAANGVTKKALPWYFNLRDC